MMIRIGLLYPSESPASPQNWSGTPNGLSEGLTSLGIEVVEIPCKLPELLRIPVALLARSGGARGMIAHREPVYAKTRSAAIARAIRRSGHLDGIIAMGTDLYDLPSALKYCTIPTTTYDDGNFALFLRYADSDLSRANYPIRNVTQWAHRQNAACHAANVVCVSTDWAKKSFVEDFMLPNSKIKVVGMGHRPRKMHGHDRSFDTPRFLFVGVDWKRKNGDAVIEAFAHVRKQFPEATLDLVGEHPNLDLPGVTGYGFLPRESAPAQHLLDHLFAHATAFVLPSLFDPSPIAYLEAASAGLPVIATTYGGAGELLGDAAINVNPHDRPALASAMLHLCNGSVARSMGVQAAARAADSTWLSVSRRIVDSLLEIRTNRLTFKNSDGAESGAGLSLAVRHKA